VIAFRMIELAWPLLLIAVIYWAVGGWRGMSRTRRRAWVTILVSAVVVWAAPWAWLDFVALVAQLIAWAAFLGDDDWGNGLRRRVKARLPRRRVLAWGVPARRPQPA
jgi:hypothetical protein